MNLPGQVLSQESNDLSKFQFMKERSLKSNQKPMQRLSDGSFQNKYPNPVMVPLELTNLYSQLQ